MYLIRFSETKHDHFDYNVETICIVIKRNPYRRKRVTVLNRIRV